MHLELFLVRVLISCDPVVEVLKFFLLELSGVPQRMVCWICYPLQGSCCGAEIASFLSSERGLEFLLFDGAQGLSCSHSGEC
jgi:hypothetical protein